eukprot:SAG31_NODE_3342_length_4383_cov_5.306723_1_plen_87_part_00
MTTFAGRYYHFCSPEVTMAGVVWRPIATIAAAVGDVELEDQVLRLSRYLGYSKVLLHIFYFLGGGGACLKNCISRILLLRSTSTGS